MRKALDIAAQVARGLAAAHERSIVHRDVKPENLFVAANGHVKILDFGLVKLSESGARRQPATCRLRPPATSPGVVLGTVGYMAPEQVLGRAADHRADIFALGAVLYELVTGTRAFARDTAPETMTAILKEEPRPLAGGRHRPRRAAADREPLSGEESFGPIPVRWRPGVRAGDALSGLRIRERHRAAPLRIAGPRARWRLWWLIAPVSLLVGAAATWLVARPAAPDARVTRFQVLAPDSWRTDLNGGLIPLALSPDGRSLAGNAINDKGETALFVRAFDALEARIVPGTEGAGSFFWSPDGRSLAFFAGGQLKRVDVAGGSATVLCDAPTANRGGAWTPGGTILFGSTMGLAAGAGYRRDADDRAGTGGGRGVPQRARARRRMAKACWWWPPWAPKCAAGRGAECVATRLGSPERAVLFDTDQFVHPVGFADGRLIFVRGTSLLAQPFDAANLQVDRRTGVARGSRTN